MYNNITSGSRILEMLNSRTAGSEAVAVDTGSTLDPQLISLESIPQTPFLSRLAKVFDALESNSMIDARGCLRELREITNLQDRWELSRLIDAGCHTARALFCTGRMSDARKALADYVEYPDAASLPARAQGTLILAAFHQASENGADSQLQLEQFQSLFTHGSGGEFAQVAQSVFSTVHALMARRFTGLAALATETLVKAFEQDKRSAFFAAEYASILLLDGSLQQRIGKNDLAASRLNRCRTFLTEEASLSSVPEAIEILKGVADSFVDLGRLPDAVRTRIAIIQAAKDLPSPDLIQQEILITRHLCAAGDLARAETRLVDIERSLMALLPPEFDRVLRERSEKKFARMVELACFDGDDAAEFIKLVALESDILMTRIKWLLDHEDSWQATDIIRSQCASQVRFLQRQIGVPHNHRALILERADELLAKDLSMSDEVKTLIGDLENEAHLTDRGQANCHLHLVLALLKAKTGDEIGARANFVAGNGQLSPRSEIRNSVAVLPLLNLKVRCFIAFDQPEEAAKTLEDLFRSLQKFNMVISEEGLRVVDALILLHQKLGNKGAGVFYRRMQKSIVSTMRSEEY